MFKKKETNVMSPDKLYPIKIFFLNTPYDTCRLDLILQTVKQLYYNFDHVEAYFSKIKIEIWNSARNDCPVETLTYLPKEHKIILPTSYVDRLPDVDAGWQTAITEVMAYTLLDLINFKKGTKIFKQWTKIRIGYNVLDPVQTFIDDYILLFAFTYGTSRIAKQSISVRSLNGITHFYLISYFVNLFYKKFLFWSEFLTMQNMDFLGFICFYYDWKIKSFHFQKITGQGVWSYSTQNDKWELVSKF